MDPGCRLHGVAGGHTRLGRGMGSGFSRLLVRFAWSDVYDRASRAAIYTAPRFAQALWPLAVLPWPVFAAMWSALLGVVLVWLLASLGWGWALPLFLDALPELVSGNEFALLALAYVLGIRRPSAWALATLTKITPCLGPVWFASDLNGATYP
jgi:hypothetical protein